MREIVWTLVDTSFFLLLLFGGFHWGCLQEYEGGVIYRSMDSLWVVTLVKEMFILPQETVHRLQISRRDRSLVNLSSIHDGRMAGQILCRSYAGNHHDWLSKSNGRVPYMFAPYKHPSLLFVTYIPSAPNYRNVPWALKEVL